MCCERGGDSRRLSALGWLPPGWAALANGDRPVAVSVGRGGAGRGGGGEGGPAVGKDEVGSGRPRGSLLRRSHIPR